METYCAKWKAEALPKPLDRNAQHISSWINAVYVEKRFYDEKATKKTPSPEISGSDQPNRSDSTAQSVNDGGGVGKELPITQQSSISTTSARNLSNNNDVAVVSVVSMAEIFGGDVPRLEISPQRNTSGGDLEPSSVHDAKTSADEENGNQIQSESAKNVESMSKKPTSLLDLGDSWDPFGALTQEQSPDAYPAAEASSNVFQDNGHTENQKIGASVEVTDKQDIRDAVQGHHTGESKSWEAFKEDLPVENSASNPFPGFERLSPPEFPGFGSTKEPPTAIWKGTPSIAISDNVGQAAVSISEKESAVANWASFGAAVADDTKGRQAHDQTTPSKPDMTPPKIASSSTSQDQASNVASGHNTEQNMAPPISKANAGSSSSLSSAATTGGQSCRPEVPLVRAWLTPSKCSEFHFVLRRIVRLCVWRSLFLCNVLVAGGRACVGSVGMVLQLPIPML